jgi:hypothetical protein
MRAMGYRLVEAHYSNPYDVTVKVSIRDAESGKDQVLVSNKIHPFFVQLPEGVTAPPSSEGHSYNGDITRGAWVDAANLKAGYRLLNDDGSWASVTGITVEQAPLTAYNLKVGDYHTYFVTGDTNASPVWVHNDCGILSFDPVQLQRKFKHAEDFGIEGTYNPSNGQAFGQAINRHLNAPGTSRIEGTYRGQPVIHYLDLNTGLNVISDRAGNFISGFRLNPSQLQNVRTRGSL